MTETTLLDVRDLTKSYASHGTMVHAVQAVSFSVGRGGSIGIVGESGSGKSTTARMLVGLEQPDAGSIHVEGVPVRSGRLTPDDRRRQARAIQMVFQDPYLSLDPRMRVGDALDAVLRLHGTHDRAQRRARTHQLLESVGLGEREADSLPRRLSGGQRQRVAIARALAVEPTVLVLDEAVSALDVSVQAQVLNLLNDIRASTGIGLVFVSHDLAVVRHVSDSCLVMQNGQVVEQGPTRSLLDSPAHPYTRLLLAAVPRRGWDPEAISAMRQGASARE